MPVYVYECSGCGLQREDFRTLEEMEKFGHTIIQKGCPKNKRHFHYFKRIITPTSFILKGSGWAKDGYQK